MFYIMVTIGDQPFALANKTENSRDIKVIKQNSNIYINFSLVNVVQSFLFIIFQWQLNLNHNY